MAQQSLITLLSIIPDPRYQDDRLKHKLIDILVISVTALMSACESWEEIEDYGRTHQEWFSEFLELPNGIPSHDTFARVFGLLDFQAFCTVFWAWVEGWKKAHGKPSSQREIINIDAKFLRGALRQSHLPRSALLMVSAYARAGAICLGFEQSELRPGEEEKRATEKLIESLYLKGAIVTLDANGATTRITERICERQGDFLIGLKTNQKSLYKLCLSAFASRSEEEVSSSYTTEEKGHGRVEKRIYAQVFLDGREIPGMQKAYKKQMAKWKDLRSFIRVESQIISHEQDGEPHMHQETRYFFSSLKGAIKDAAEAVRSHWGVENLLHWQLDVSFREDHWQARIKHSAENLAAVRRMILNMLKQEKSFKGGIKRKMKKCGWDPKYLETVLLAQPAPC